MSDDLIAYYRNIHASKSWGTSGNRFSHPAQVLIAEIKPATLINYGCGQTNLHEELSILGAQCFRYDPAIPEVSSLPLTKADFLVNTDVLEHIPEAQLDKVISEMASISQRAFINISTRLAAEILPNGENAHCTIKTPDEWNQVLSRHFETVNTIYVEEGDFATFLTWDSPLAGAVADLVEIHALRKSAEKNPAAP